MHIKCDICATDFMISIFADPIYKGDWPASVKERSPPNLLPITPDLVRPSSWLCLSGLCIRVRGTFSNTVTSCKSLSLD